MDHHVVLLHPPTRLPNNVDHFDLLCHRARNGIQGAQLAHAMGCDDTSGSLLDPGVSIGCVGGVQFVGIAYPLEALDIVNVVKQCKVEVAGDTEDLGDSDLFYTLPEEAAEGNRCHDG